jgi:hypothetical protein
MDAKNWFATETTYRLMRLEYAVALVICAVLFLTHLGEVRWVPFVLLFVYIDAIGYIPGAIAYHRAGHQPISRSYYLAYNVMHCLATQMIVALLWIWAFGPEWALLALPIHLFGDRALFGNFLKPFAVSFEPVEHPAFTRFRAELDATPALAAHGQIARTT